MALGPEDSVLIEKVARFALYHRNLPAKNFNFPRNLAPIVEKWIIDKHPFRLDGLVLLGFCIVAHSNVKILLKQVQEASEKITAELKLLLLRTEICTEIGELSNWNFKNITEFDDLEPPDDEILEQMSICNDGEE
uniref:Uncharacterized protein n=1 Tax=Caenorhabditis japonica TaxID=281687 RepID=A0A8R1EMP0_CAEJA